MVCRACGVQKNNDGFGIKQRKSKICKKCVEIRLAEVAISAPVWRGALELLSDLGKSNQVLDLDENTTVLADAVPHLSPDALDTVIEAMCRRGLRDDGKEEVAELIDRIFTMFQKIHRHGIGMSGYSVSVFLLLLVRTLSTLHLSDAHYTFDDMWRWFFKFGLAPSAEHLSPQRSLPTWNNSVYIHNELHGGTRKIPSDVARAVPVPTTYPNPDPTPAPNMPPIHTLRPEVVGDLDNVVENVDSDFTEINSLRDRYYRTQPVDPTPSKPVQVASPVDATSVEHSWKILLRPEACIGLLRFITENPTRLSKKTQAEMVDVAHETAVREPGVEILTHIIKYYIRDKNTVLARTTLREMEKLGYHSLQVLYADVLTTASSVEDVEAVYKQAQAQGPIHLVVRGAYMLQMARFEQTDKLIAVFESSEKNTYGYNVVFKHFAHTQNISKLLLYYKEMQESKVQPDIFSFATLVKVSRSACAQEKR
jgi:pentatricopeptide repeat protein